MNESNLITPPIKIVGGEIAIFKEMLFSTLPATSTETIIDFSEVSIIDSEGIGVILHFRNTLKNENHNIIIRHFNGNILKMFKLMDLDKYFRLE